MLKLTNPRLRRFNVVVNSLDSGVSDTSKEFPRTPEVTFSKVVSKPWMFLKKAIGRITLKQLKSLTNTHGRRKFNKQVDVVNSNVEFIDFTLSPVSNLSQEKLTIHSKPIELEGVFGIFNFPHKVEGVLSEAMLPEFQIHFSSPKSAGDKAHANLNVYFEEPSIQALPNSQTGKLNLLEDGDSSLSLKAEVPSPLM